MFYLAQMPPPIALVQYVDNATKNQSELLPANDPRLVREFSDGTEIKGITLGSWGEITRAGGFSVPNISSGRQIYTVHASYQIYSEEIYRYLDAETGDILGGSVTYQPKPGMPSCPPNISCPPPPLPPMRSGVPPQLNTANVPEPSVLLGISSLGMVILLRKRNKRN